MMKCICRWIQPESRAIGTTLTLPGRTSGDTKKQPTSWTIGTTLILPGRMSGDTKKNYLKTLKPTKNVKYPTRIFLICKVYGTKSEKR